MMLAVLFAVVIPAALSSATKPDCVHATPDGLDDAGDTCTMMQLPVKQRQAVISHKGCRAVLPLLASHGNDLRDMCQQALPSDTCKDALGALGAGPWSEDVVSKVCEVWSDGVMNNARASLLARSTLTASGTSLAAMDEALDRKGDEK